MKRYLFAVLAAVAVTFALPELGHQALAAPVVMQGAGGDSTGSLPAVASASTMRTSWTCSCHNMKQEVETKADTGDSPGAQAKRHDYAVQELANLHPATAGPAGAMTHGSNARSGGIYKTFWRTPLAGGFAWTGVETTPGVNVPPASVQAWHQARVIALAVEMPAL